jgi:chondroitin 4-sulfotransferase 11
MSWLTQELRTTRWHLRQKYLLDFVFIHIPKTAGSSIHRTLELTAEHKTALQLRGRLGKRRWERKFKFAFVRNPWDRVVSSFHYAATRTKNSRFVDLTFSQWLKLAYVDRHPLYFDAPHLFSPQYDWISDNDDNLIVDFVGRFENLEHDFAKVCERIGRTGLQLPHDNATKHQDYRHYYKDSEIEIIARWYKKDIEHFGYVFSAPTVIAHPIRRAG